MSFFTFVAEEVREWLARLGVRRLDEIVGRTELLEILPGGTEKQKNLDLSPLLGSDLVSSDKPNICQVDRNLPHDQGHLANEMLNMTLPAILSRKGGEFFFKVCNSDRSIGARLSGEIARRYGNPGLGDQPLRINLAGSAGQSLGVWNVGGLEMRLEGEANDYVGKGMAGGKLVIHPPRGSHFLTQETTIIGNTCLYGATGGTLYAAGRAGERLGVRNSGAVAVVEGAGDHCCEYMTGGLIAVLGSTGHNFGAGMTGGFAYVLDMNRNFVDRYNHELVDIHRIDTEAMDSYQTHLLSVLDEYVQETQSAWGQEIIDQFYGYSGRFWLVKPKATDLDSLLGSYRGRSE